MSDSNKNKISSNSGGLLSNILDISNVSQRVCAENMGFHSKYLSNYIQNLIILPSPVAMRKYN